MKRHAAVFHELLILSDSGLKSLTLRYAAIICLLLFAPALSHATDFSSYLVGPTACHTASSPPPPPATFQMFGPYLGYLSFMPFTWEVSCVRPFEGVNATGKLQAQVNLFRLSVAGEFSFSCCTGDTGSATFPVQVNDANARVQDRVNISGGTGTGTLRMTFLFAGTGTGSRAKVNLPTLHAELVNFGAPLFFRRHTPGILVAEFPFTFGTPLKFFWETSAGMELTETNTFSNGGGASGNFDFTATLISVEVIGVPSATVISETGLRYPTATPGNPPVFAPTFGFSCGQPIEQVANTPPSFDLSASDSDVGNTVTLDAIGLPSGANMKPGVPRIGNPVSSTFSWTPTPAQVGSHEIVFKATDNTGLQTQCSTIVDVVPEPVIFIPGSQEVSSLILKANNGLEPF
jgi:putative Ig domain-containing protein